MDNTKVTKSFISQADYSAKKGYAVYVNATIGFNKQPKVTLAGANAANVIGIVEDGGRQSGDEVCVVVSGSVEMAILGTGGATVGDFLKTDSNGALVTSLGSGTDNVVAVALGTGVAGDFIPVQLRFFVY